MYPQKNNKLVWIKNNHTDVDQNRLKIEWNIKNRVFGNRLNTTYFYCANFSKTQCPAKLRVDFDHEESVIAVSSCGLHSEHCKTLGFEKEESKSKVKDMLESLTGSGMLRSREI